MATVLKLDKKRVLEVAAAHLERTSSSCSALSMYYSLARTSNVGEGARTKIICQWFNVETIEQLYHRNDRLQVVIGHEGMAKVLSDMAKEC